MCLYAKPCKFVLRKAWFYLNHSALIYTSIHRFTLTSLVLLQFTSTREALGTKYVVPDTWYLIPSYCYHVLPVPGTKPLVSSTWYRVSHTKYLAPRTWHQVLGATYWVPCTGYQVLGTGYVVPNIVTKYLVQAFGSKLDLKLQKSKNTCFHWPNG